MRRIRCAPSGRAGGMDLSTLGWFLSYVVLPLLFLFLFLAGWGRIFIPYDRWLYRDPKRLYEERMRTEWSTPKPR